MTGFPLARAAAVLALASLAATASPVAATALAAGAQPGPPVHRVTARPVPAGATWPSRLVLRESQRVRGAAQVLDLPGREVFALVPVNRADSRFQLRRTSLATGATLIGSRTYDVSSLRMARGYLWVYGPVFSGPNSTDVHVVLHQVSMTTLRVVRSWALTTTIKLNVLAEAAVAPGPGRTVWVGFLRTLRLVDVTNGAVLKRSALPEGFDVSDVATDPQRRFLYAAAAPRIGGGAVFEFDAHTGLLLASHTGKPIRFAVDGADLTAVPGGVWASYRTGMLGQTILLRQKDLSVAPLHAPVFGWAMFATTISGGGALWLSEEGAVLGCIGPQTGRVRLRTKLPALGEAGQLLAVAFSQHKLYAAGQKGIVAIAPPASCWA